MKLFQVVVRSILSLLLLWQVWMHSHWSIALSITLIALSLEEVCYAGRGIIKLLTEKLLNEGGDR